MLDLELIKNKILSLYPEIKYIETRKYDGGSGVDYIASMLFKGINDVKYWSKFSNDIPKIFSDVRAKVTISKNYFGGNEYCGYIVDIPVPYVDKSISDKASIKFKSNEEGKCPICNSQMLEYFGMELEDTAVYFPWHCPDCDTDGKEWYYVNFSEVRDNNDTIGETEGICPTCGGEIEYGTAEPEGNSLGYEYFCSECGGSGKEWYDLDFDSQTVDGHENEDIIMESKQLTEADDEGYYAGYADNHKDVLNKLMSLWQLKKDKDGSKFVLDCSGKKVEIYKPEGDKKYSLFLDDKWYMEDNLAVLKRMGINFYLGQTAKADVEKTFKDNDIPLDDTKQLINKYIGNEGEEE